MMKSISLFLVNSNFTATIIYLTLSSARGSPVRSSLPLRIEDRSSVPQPRNSPVNSSNANEYIKTQNVTNMSQCNPVEYKPKDVTILENGDLILKAQNVTVHSSGYQKKNGTIYVCMSSKRKLDNRLVLNCSEKFEYEKFEYHILPNNSAVVGDEIIPEGEYELDNGILLACVTDDEYFVPNGTHKSRMSLNHFSIYVGQIGSAISIVALTVHLLTFIAFPTLRNLPGYNLASLSVAFLLAYSFVLIGQIPQVRGSFCVASGVLQQNFFLVAFFCMNVLAFDVWRMLKLTTQRLMVGSQNIRKRQFMWYSLYAWGVPLVITSISVVVDNVRGVPSSIRPYYGKDDVCWMNNKLSKAIFFAVPAFTLFLVNAVFFLMSSWMISNNKMKVSMDQTKQTMKLNYVLYVRLAIMMGLTWLVGLVGIVTRNAVIWFIFDLLNSLQGLFLFLLFTCTKKVFKHLAEMSSAIKLSSAKQTTVMSHSSSTSARNDKNSMKF